MMAAAQRPVRSAWLSPAEADQRRALASTTKPDVQARTAAVEEAALIPTHDFLVDIGVNLAHKRFSHDLSEVIQRAIDAKVAKMVITGTSVVASRRAIEIAKLTPGVLFSTAGVHPHDAKSWTAATAQNLRNLITRNKATVKAIGECGLDFDRNFSTPDDQIRAFRAQLDLACEMNLPVFLHERAAFEQFFGILKEYRPRLGAAVVHCFTGTTEELDAYLSLDLHIGITGWVCDERRGLELLRMTPRIPLNRLMIETWELII
jgi:TatD DNase family protein